MPAKKNFGGQSMDARLRRVLICPPDVAGWNDPARAGRWRDLGYHHEPDPAAARAQHRALQSRLEEVGAEVLLLPADAAPSLDAVYTHDPSLVTDRGAVCLRMGKPARGGEPAGHAAFYRAAGIGIAGEIEAPGTVEAGDLVWLDGSTLLAGRGYRTNAEGLRQLAALLAPDGAEVIEAPLPHGRGPGFCLHLMSLLSVLEDGVVLADPAWLAVPTIELLRRRDFRLIELEPSERDTMAVNVLALGERRLLALEENRRTNQRLREAGFDVRTFPGSEISLNGGGGPTCLTRPLLRD